MKSHRFALWLALLLLGAPVASRAHEGEDHSKKGDAAATEQGPAATPPKGADPNADPGIDAERRAATRRKLADDAAAKQKEAAEKGTPPALPAPSGAPPGIGPK